VEPYALPQFDPPQLSLDTAPDDPTDSILLFHDEYFFLSSFNFFLFSNKSTMNLDFSLTMIIIY
jgi:hypothetical protein